MENPTENDRKPDNRAGCAVADGSAWLRSMESYPPVFRVQSASGPEAWKHCFSEPFLGPEAAERYMRELHALGFRARVIREQVTREIFDTPNTVGSRGHGEDNAPNPPKT